MTAGFVAPLVPPTPSDGLPVPPQHRRPPLPFGPLPPVTTNATVCGAATMDCNGRIVEAAVIRALEWVPGTRLDMRVHGGLVLITADPTGVFRIRQPFHLRLPAAVRHWCGLHAGDRVLLTADVNRKRLGSVSWISDSLMGRDGSSMDH
jgi:hypothetical protein